MGEKWTIALADGFSWVVEKERTSLSLSAGMSDAFLNGTFATKAEALIDLIGHQTRDLAMLRKQRARAVAALRRERKKDRRP